MEHALKDCASEIALLCAQNKELFKTNEKSSITKQDLQKSSAITLAEECLSEIKLLCESKHHHHNTTTVTNNDTSALDFDHNKLILLSPTKDIYIDTSPKRFPRQNESSLSAEMDKFALELKAIKATVIIPSPKSHSHPVRNNKGPKKVKVVLTEPPPPAPQLVQRRAKRRRRPSQPVRRPVVVIKKKTMQQKSKPRRRLTPAEIQHRRQREELWKDFNASSISTHIQRQARAREKRMPSPSVASQENRVMVKKEPAIPVRALQRSSENSYLQSYQQRKVANYNEYASNSSSRITSAAVPSKTDIRLSIYADYRTRNSQMVYVSVSSWKSLVCAVEKEFLASCDFFWREVSKINSKGELITFEKVSSFSALSSGDILCLKDESEAVSVVTPRSKRNSLKEDSVVVDPCFTEGMDESLLKMRFIKLSSNVTWDESGHSVLHTPKALSSQHRHRTQNSK